MLYGCTTEQTDWTVRSINDWRVRLIKVLLFFVPRANPDVERLYPLVREWALELSEDGWPQREIGLDSSGRPLFATPNERNTGYWTDMGQKQFLASELRPITPDEFARLWSGVPANGA